ncbi:Cobalamin (vitamin B12)-binding module cap domain-containing protein [Dioscorea alata]|uniref:Cobalamin (Vitamin B12)-binding module cap domain-containing protein n=1 Tax=Dioscorea alata TaxID=55571 RepID=A0ACB7VVU0_DIOAL|nr:Cobalamin (vitamin B12)-binding module cap domain-containing protein [Dioscorea alata]
MQVVMESSLVLDSGGGLSVNGPIRLGTRNNEADSVSDDLMFLDDWDSYCDDLNARLTVSRMVSNSVVKGIVNAVMEDASEKIASKEAEITFLSEKLMSCDSNVVGDQNSQSVLMMPELSRMIVEPQGTNLELCSCYFDGNVHLKFDEKMSRLRIKSEEQFLKLKDEIMNLRASESLDEEKAVDRFYNVDGCVNALEETLAAMYERIGVKFFSLKPVVAEQQSEDGLQNEIGSVMVGLQDEFEKGLHEQRTLVDTCNEKWQKHVSELSDIRQELDTISRSLFSSESGFMFSQSNTECLEEWNNAKRKDHISWNVMGKSCLSHSDENCNPLMDKSDEAVKQAIEVTVSPLLKHMKKEELIGYHTTEMTKMKRQHELALQEKTEELFSLKRELLKEKGSNPSHFRKDKEFELLRKKISEFLGRLDVMLLENGEFPVVCDDQNVVENFMNKIHTLLALTRSKDVASSQLSCHAHHHSPAEIDLRKRIRKLELDFEDAKIEASISNEVQKIALKGVVEEIESCLEAEEIENKFIQEIYLTLYMGTIMHALSSIHPAVDKWYEEKNCMEAALLEKEKSLSFRIEENEKLEQVISSISTLLKEKENFASEVASKFIEQKKHLDLASQELEKLRGIVSKQETLISENKIEYDLVKGRLDEALLQIQGYQFEINKLDQNSKFLVDALADAEKQKNILHTIIQEKNVALSSVISKEKDQTEHMKSIIFSMKELSRIIEEFECRLTCDFGKNESRLNILNQQCSQLVQQADLYKQESLRHRQKYEVMCSDFQKAEIEVDLLGNEVDALLTILEMIYIALDHYSNVLQYYPGVKEILDLLRRELKKRYITDVKLSED